MTFPTLRSFAFASLLIARAAAGPTDEIRISVPPHVELGIDVVEAGNFAALKGKRIGLLTHPAGVDSHGLSTVEILRHAPGVQLVALFATEHGIWNTIERGTNFPDARDPRTGLMVYSLYNGQKLEPHEPSAAQLKGIDALVIDLQDIGVRSYTFTGTMKRAMAGCFRHNVEVIVLDRPNPLGGLKVDGPLPDPGLVGKSLVIEFPVPYVHGLTMGELARLVKGTPGILAEKDRLRGRLTVIPMVGWQRKMRWTETGLTWIPPSPKIPDFPSVEGYAMTGLGCEPTAGHFRSGVGNLYPFRGILNLIVKPEVVARELKALKIPGLSFRQVSVPSARTGQPATGLYIEISDWDEWRPTELSFQLMRLACKLEPRNPFAADTKAQTEEFLHYMGSSAFFHELVTKGAHADVEGFIRQWSAQDLAYRDHSRQFWLYR